MGAVRATHVTSKPDPVARGGRELAAAALPWAVVISVAFLLSTVFSPGIVTSDSLVQYENAVAHRYSSAYPPFIAWVLHLLLAAGGSLASLTHLQCLSGCLGVFVLAREVVSTAAPDLSRTSRDTVALAVFAVLIVLPPLSFHLVAYWKDTWLLILFCWTIAGLLRAARTGRPGLAAFAMIAAALAGLTRFNAVPVLLLFGAASWLALPAAFRRRAWLVPAAPLLFWLLLAGALRLACPPVEFSVTDVLRIHELVALHHAHPDLRPDLPYTAEALLRLYPDPGDGSDFRDRYYHLGPMPGVDSDRLRTEYGRILRGHPGALVELKTGLFLRMLGWNGIHYWFPFDSTPNDKGLDPDPSYAPARAALRAWAQWIGSDRAARSLLASHLPWFAASLGGGVFLLVRWLRRRRDRDLFLASLAALPAAYALTFLLVPGMAEFRYVYPSSLVAQVAVLAGAAALTLRRREVSSGR